MFKDSQEIIDKMVSNVDDKKSDFLKRENSNYIYGLPLLRKNVHNYEEEKYLIENILNERVMKLYQEGDIYLHDKSIQPYCNSLSTKDISTKGVPSLSPNMLSSSPTKNIYRFIRHISNAVTFMSQQVSGAVMLSQMTTILASYFYYHNDVIGKPVDIERFTDNLEELIWELNLPLRGGSESPFTNITLEFGKASAEISDEYVTVGNEILDIQYKDIPTEYFNIVDNVIIDIMKEGSGNHMPYTFPLITVPVTDDFDWKNQEVKYLLKELYNFGGVYFENFTTKAFDNEYYKSLNPRIKSKDPEVNRSLCCRLQIDLSLLSKTGGGVFGSSSGNTGAVQVINLNAHRILLKHKYEYNGDIEMTKAEMTRILNIMEEGHQEKRRWIEANKELYPTFFAYNSDLKNYFNVFAVTGFHEGLINIGLTEGLKNDEGKKLTHELLSHMSDVVEGFIVSDNVACGVEYAPAENASIKMARDDRKFAKKEYGIDIFTQGEGDDIYFTSGAMLPFSDPDIMEQVENHAEFQGYATSGTIFHNFLEEILEPDKLANYVQKLFEKPINYITISPTLTICMDCGKKYLGQDAKNIESCTCGSDDIATSSRVIGYTKMISRKNIRVDETGKYVGEHNFWSNAKRYDWNSRKRIKSEDIDLVK